MAYEKQVWQSNELITAEKLNHIEDGISELNQDATQSTSGLMTAADKTKLDGITAGAAVTSVNNQTGAVSITPANIGAVANTDIINSEHGGTGAASASAGANILLSALPVWSVTPTDDTYLIRKDTTGANSFGQIKFSTIFSYIKNKLEAGELTISGPLNITNTESSGDGVRIWEGVEGGNIRIYSQDGHYFEIDAYNNKEIRCRGVNDEPEANNADHSVKFNRLTGVLSAPGGFDGNATTASGVKDAGDSSKTITIRWKGSAAPATDYIPMYDSNGNLVPVKLADLKTKLGIT